jgi:proline-specific peptidase
MTILARYFAPLIAALCFTQALPLAAHPEGVARRTAAWGPPDREMMIPVEGGRVYVRINGEVGPGSATPALFIHGGPGGTHAGFAAMLGLAEARPVILYDQLGSGRSDRPDDPANWRVERFVEEIEAIRRAVGAERLHLLGFSWGSALALEYAARFPDRTASIVLGGTFISTAHWLTDANILKQDLDESQRDILQACESDAPPEPERCGEIFKRVYSRHYDPPARSEQMRDYLRQYGGAGFNPLIYRGMWGPSEFSSTGSLKQYDATLRLLEIDGSRVLFLIGQYDSARIDTVQEFVALAPGAELAVVPGGGHGFMLDRPLETEAILRSWLARQDARP